MQAMRCDRCKEFYMPYHENRGVPKNEFANTVMFVEKGNVNQITKYHRDLCPRCMRLVRYFVENSPIHEIEEAE